MINSNRSRAAAVALIAISLMMASPAQPATPVPTEMSVERLKSAYLECERAAVDGRLATGEIMLCSVLYEELKRRAFDGDFPRLKAWADQYLRAPRDRERAAEPMMA